MSLGIFSLYRGRSVGLGLLSQHDLLLLIHLALHLIQLHAKSSEAS
jgi:hypothetical protein